jgi:DNA polymerase III delta subunit
MNTSCLDFLQKKELDKGFYMLYGDEPACIFKSKEHIIQCNFLNSEFTRINLDLEDDDFIEILNEATMSQDMFASGKIIFFKFSKNRLNKEIREKIELISNHEADIVSVLEISEVKVSTLRKELFSILSRGMLIDCSEPSEKEIFNFLRLNLPDSLVSDEQIKLHQSLYEGNFSALLNDMELLKIVDDSKYIESIFSESSVKDNRKIINYLADNKIDSVIDVINYYEKNEPGIIPLLVWLFNRDLQAVNMILSRSGSVRKLGIWDSQLASYNKIAKRFNKKKIESALSLLDESDKKFKGFLKGSPWDSLREVVFKFV